MSFLDLTNFLTDLPGSPSSGGSEAQSANSDSSRVDMNLLLDSLKEKGEREYDNRTNEDKNEYSGIIRTHLLNSSSNK